MNINFFKHFFRCKYAPICPYYRKDAFTCNIVAEKNYCGKYREFEEERVEK